MGLIHVLEQTQQTDSAGALGTLSAMGWEMQQVNTAMQRGCKSLTIATTARRDLLQSPSCCHSCGLALIHPFLKGLKPCCGLPGGSQEKHHLLSPPGSS